MTRIGVFVCHCGINIAGTVDVQSVAEEIGRHPDVAFATDYSYMCSEPGQQLVRDAISDHELDAVVVAACSPSMHEATFRRAASSEGLNPYRLEIANIREQCSWVHEHQPALATEKAIEVVQTVVEKVKRDEELEPFQFPLTKRAMVIGGGIAGMQVAQDIADAGFPVVLVEREDHLGGKMAQLSGTYLNFDAAPGLLQRKVDRVLAHPNIDVLTASEVISVDGYVGNFEVRVAHSDASQERAQPGTSGVDHPIGVGAIVLATGWDAYPLHRLPEYGGGEVEDVVDGLTFERMLRDGDLRRPSDGRRPREVVFVQCAGSRDPEHGVSYCSKVCCMVVAKQAMMFKEHVPEGQAYVFYIDIRSAGKGYDEYVQEAMEEQDILYLRGKVSKIFSDGKSVRVWGVDTLSNQPIGVAADLVVLATAMLPSDQALDIAQKLRVSADEYGFFSEAHPKLRPVESLTAGIFLAGAAQGPKDIPETVSQASGAAAKVLRLFSHDVMTQEPTVAYVVEELCSGCGACVAVCPYEARALDPVRNIATVNAALCQNCGACLVACPNKASRIHNWTPEQILAMADAVMSGTAEV
ncbi:MAG: CoB--CoM heterodisulfide reductase iron-sulfur subunit A family protein [Anaerolineae bacterium]|nr:CoB--CoM heterodisulfide reductase iron-sulfur subunit A family protein [Anaerolineae bacterium]